MQWKQASSPAPKKSMAVLSAEMVMALTFGIQKNCRYWIPSKCRDPQWRVICQLGEADLKVYQDKIPVQIDESGLLLLGQYFGTPVLSSNVFCEWLWFWTGWSSSPSLLIPPPSDYHLLPNMQKHLSRNQNRTVDDIVLSTIGSKSFNMDEMCGLQVWLCWKK